PARRKEISTSESVESTSLQPDPEAPVAGRRPRTTGSRAPRPAATGSRRGRTPANPNPGIAGETVASYDAAAPDLSALGIEAPLPPLEAAPPEPAGPTSSRPQGRSPAPRRGR